MEGTFFSLTAHMLKTPDTLRGLAGFPGELSSLVKSLQYITVLAAVIFFDWYLPGIVWKDKHRAYEMFYMA